MSGKINSHICLMLSVYKGFHQTSGIARGQAPPGAKVGGRQNE